MHMTPLAAIAISVADLLPSGPYNSGRDMLKEDCADEERNVIGSVATLSVVLWLL